MRKFCSILITIIFAINLIGCTSKGSENTNVHGKLSIDVTPEYTEAIKTIVGEFNKTYPNINVDIKSSANIQQDGKIEANSDADLLCINENNLRGILNANSDKLKPLNLDLIPISHLTNYKVDGYTYNGKRYGIPLFSSPVIIAYREDHLNSIGKSHDEIKTWDDLIALGPKLKEKGLETTAFSNDSKNDFTETLIEQININYYKDQKKNNSDKGISIAEREKLRQINMVYDKLYSSSKRVSNTPDIDMLKRGDISYLVLKSNNISSLISDKDLMKNIRFARIPSFSSGGNRDVEIDTAVLLSSINSRENTTNIFLKYVSSNYTYKKELYNKHLLYPTDIRIFESLDFKGEYKYQGLNPYQLMLSSMKKSYPFIPEENYKEYVESIKNGVYLTE